MSGLMLVPVQEGRLTWPQRAEALVITDETRERAMEDYTGLGMLRKAIVAKFETMKKAAKASHQAACDMEKEYLDPVVKAEAIYKRKLEDDRRAQRERERRDAEERQALADREAADRAEASAQLDDIETELFGPGAVDIPVPDAIVPEVSPASVADEGWAKSKRPEVTDVKALCRAIADGQVPESLVKEWDMKWLRERVRQDGQKFNVPGVTVRDDETIRRSYGDAVA